MEVSLRPWRDSDLESLVKYGNNPKIANNLSDGFPHPYTEEVAREFLKVFAEKKSHLILAIDVNGEAVGSIGIHLRKDIYRKNAEIGYWLGEPFWGKGILSKVVPQMVEKGFEKFDIVRLYAPIFARNKASQRVLEKCGFKVEARLYGTVFKNGKFEDEVVLGLRKKDWESE